MMENLPENDMCGHVFCCTQLNQLMVERTLHRELLIGTGQPYRPVHSLRDMGYFGTVYIFPPKAGSNGIYT